ncbi:hypothetical protein [Fimbriimonas ginsengisoli]|uniref:Uncharacterized protein n=1 Tax=Fimbriimonas ginsengisoli Gsoil 348 TaxID=661478 RepID=A0A068NNT5_FIMGI|nr:hypothetical protein [Fimbriimonas ginsengisoli]AIE85086.1 hypothetical protein OP10G_1718 [Fimbriimonas ginsengisoli Gsoil 348]
MSVTQQKQYLTREEFERLREGEERRLQRVVADYHDDVLVISSFDSHLNYHFQLSDAPTRIEVRNRFYDSGGLSPDFIVDFTNGYRLVVERKRSWSDYPSKSLQQLSRYKALASRGSVIASATIGSGSKDSDVQTQLGDVVLLIGHGDDEQAAESIANAPELGPKSIVVFDSQQEAFKVNNATVKFTCRKLGGWNGLFVSENVASPDSEYNLNNLLIGPKRGFVARCDKEALVQAGECPFINDAPPPYYTICHLFLPAINELLAEADRDDLASEAESIHAFAYDSIVGVARRRFTRLPEGKIQTWLRGAVKLLIDLGIVTTSYIEGIETLNLKLGPKNDRLQSQKMIEKIARISVRRAAVIYSEDPKTRQLQLEFD